MIFIDLIIHILYIRSMVISLFTAQMVLLEAYSWCYLFIVPIMRRQDGRHDSCAEVSSPFAPAVVFIFLREKNSYICWKKHKYVVVSKHLFFLALSFEQKLLVTVKSFNFFLFAGWYSQKQVSPTLLKYVMFFTSGTH